MIQQELSGMRQFPLHEQWGEVEKVCMRDFGSWVWIKGDRLKLQNFSQMGMKSVYYYANS